MENLSTDTSLTFMQALQSDPSKLANIKNAKRIDEAAKQFEAVFITEMLNPMFENLETDGLFGGGQGEKVFRSIMLQEYGKKLSETGSVGLADHVKEELIRIQGQTLNTPVEEGTAG